jgi:hypothetical protein
MSASFYEYVDRHQDDYVQRLKEVRATLRTRYHGPANVASSAPAASASTNLTTSSSRPINALPLMQAVAIQSVSAEPDKR